MVVCVSMIDTDVVDLNSQTVVVAVVAAAAAEKKSSSSLLMVAPWLLNDKS